jgi:2,3-bisphosphoglycerate-dependent phosphoglycerate mutase
MPTVWFIRHGQSESNADLITKHPAESALTELGLWEAERVVRAFRRAPDLIVQSPFLRARQTAVPTITQFPHTPVETWPVEEFTYLDPIHYDGTTGAERWPIALTYWERNDPLYKDGGVAESFAELAGRVTAVTTRLQQRPEPFIAIFSHGLFLRTLLLSLIVGQVEGTPDCMRHYAHFIRALHMPNAAILQVNFSPDAPITFTGFRTEHLVDN